VTNFNREQFVSLYVNHLLVKSVERQFQAFSRGFHKVSVNIFDVNFMEVISAKYSLNGQKRISLLSCARYFHVLSLCSNPSV